jgi:TolA-binding protein
MRSFAVMRIRLRQRFLKEEAMDLKTRWVLSLSCILIMCPALAQVRPGGGSSTPSAPRLPTASTSSIPPEARAVIVRGKVALQDGTALTEPIAIERVCSGAVRREGYTDFKGNFEFQLGQGSEGRDATESGRDVFQNSGNRGPTQGPGADYGMAMPSSSRTSDSTRPELLGCEIRASLPGFKTSSVLLRPEGSSWSLNVGVIVLTRMETMPGAIISLTTMSAPADARNAYEKGQKDVARGKFSDAEKELSKAVSVYPDFAAAWSMLGEVRRQQDNLAAAKEAYLRAISADPQFVSPYFGMAIVAVHEKNWSDVLKYSGEALKLNPALFPLANMYNGAANYYLGNLDAAEQSVRRFQTMDADHHNPDSALLLSNILLAKHDYAGAGKALEEYLKLVPNAPNAAEIKKQLKDLNDMNLAKQ